MRAAQVVAALALWCLMSGCKPKVGMDIPYYPGAMPGQGSTSADGDITLYHAKLMTSDFGHEIRAFYDAQMLPRGWKKTMDSKEMLEWTDENLKRDSSGKSWAPIDPARPGGLIQATLGENQSVILIWQSVPKPK